MDIWRNHFSHNKSTGMFKIALWI